jgi:hypothetical protein
MYGKWLMTWLWTKWCVGMKLPSICREELVRMLGRNHQDAFWHERCSSESLCRYVRKKTSRTILLCAFYSARNCVSHYASGLVNAAPTGKYSESNLRRRQVHTKLHCPINLYINNELFLTVLWDVLQDHRVPQPLKLFTPVADDAVSSRY